LLALTPLRLLLFLAVDAARAASGQGGRRAASVLFGLGGLALVGFDALIVWWALADGGSAGLPLPLRLLVQAALGLLAAWVLFATVDLGRGTPAAPRSVRPRVRRWVALLCLAGGLLAAFVWRMPLLAYLARASHGPAFDLPAPAVALGSLAASPAAWTALLLGLVAWRLAESGPGQSWRAGLPRWLRLGRGSDPALALERGIRRGAGALRALVEAGAFGGALTAVARGVLRAAHLAHRWIEGGVLDGTARQIARTTAQSGRIAYRVMEQGGLEGLLRSVVRALLAGSRWLQRRHTGRLRRNLIWVAASLALAALGLILYVW
jgi:hypothetical protein